MKRLLKLGMGALVCGLALLSHAANNFTTNDLYLGFTESGALDDYIIDFGQRSVVGAGGTTVKDLSGDFSAATFNSVFTGGPVGVLVSVVGGNNTFGHGDLYATQLRTSNLGNPALPGSALTISNVSSLNLTPAAAVLLNVMATTGGLPSAGQGKLDSGLTYTKYVNDTTGNNSAFPAKSGIAPYATLGSSSNIVMDLWYVPASSPTNAYLGYFTFSFTNSAPKLTFTPPGVTVTAPTASFSGSPVSGSAPLPVVFTDASSGFITNWIWNFGNGVTITNTSNVSVTNIYSSGGTYAVALTVAGPGGLNTQTRTSYISVTGGASVPGFSSALFSGGQLVLNCTNGSASTQYRVQISTNLSSGIWQGIYTNNFLSNGSFSYTNNSLTSPSAFFRVVSP